jgi:acetyl-CoA synthetase
MDYKIISKPSIGEFSVKPNLYNYKEIKNTLDWENIQDGLDGLPNGGLNLAYEAIDRHAAGKNKNKVALHWESSDGIEEKYTFNDLKFLSDKFANVLSELGILKGDRVFIFMERIPELYIAFLGILKVGAIAGPLFSAFGPDPVKDRLEDSGAKLLIATPTLLSRIKSIIKDLPALQNVIVVTRGKELVEEIVAGQIIYEKAMLSATDLYASINTSEEDYSIMHYTSGTTGKPKGAVHAHKAALQHLLTGRWALDLQDSDIYWCTAGPGWVTGTSYGISAPWTNGITQVIYEGGFSASKWYEIIEKYSVSVWYTAPTAIRMLMKAGDNIPQRYNLSSLRHICSVGEPLNPEAIVWAERVLGLPIHDNWWQTETGAILIANYPSEEIRLGSMGKPIPGINASILGENGNPVDANVEGDLAIKTTWPSMFRSYWQNEKMYNSKFKNGWYITGDRAKVDEDGYFWFVGRADDVINTAGHLVGPFEVESALMEHPAVAEAGVIGKPDPISMEIVKAFVSLHEGYEESDSLRNEIMGFVRRKLSAAIAPREISFIDSLPKTRSGKIMRRLLKARELGLPEGDTSTLEDD